MPRQSQGAIVIQQDSPWTEFLNGIGQGVSMGVKNRINKADERQRRVQEFMLASMQGTIDPSKFASEDFQRFAQEADIYDHPDIQGLIASARQSLPKEMTEAPPAPGAEYVQSTPLAPGQSPVVGEGGSNVVSPGGMGPGLAVMPTAQITPTSKAVHNYLLKKQEDRSLAIEEIRGRQQLRRSMELQSSANDLAQGRKLGLGEALKRSMEFDKMAGLTTGYDVTYSLGPSGLTTNYRPIDIDKTQAREDKQNAKETKFETTASKYATGRLHNVLRLQDLLSRDTVSLADLGFTGDEDPDVAKLLASTASLLSSKAPAKDKVNTVVDHVKSAIDAINKTVDRYNREIEMVGDNANLPPEKTMGGFVKRLTFEEVSGGLTPEQYKAKKNPPTAGELISQVRDDYQPSRITSNLPASSSGKESDRVQDAYKGIAGVVQTAMGSNQGLTRESIRGNIMEMKDQIMAEYGLNERSFSLLLTMADRAMA